MISLALSAIATQLNAKYQGDDVVITHVSTDTRTIKVGDLFVALSGDNFDANSFVAKAAEQGAIAAIVTKKQAVDIPQIQVKDSRVALGLLGKMVREHVNPKVAALTGSNGKTTTKEMLAAILKQVAPTLATAGNFNNDIGVPLTLLRLQQEDQFAVMELGANHKKEIAYTTGLVLPDVVLINNVDAAHLEGFGDLQGIALAKSEILSGVKEQGMAVLNRDDKFYQYWLRKVDSQRHVNFSVVDESADYFAANIEFADSGNPTFRLCTPDSDCSINLGVAGRHNVANALAAAAMASCFGIDIKTIKLGLESMVNVQGRLKISQLTPRIRIIDDSYNANIASVKAAIDVLTHFKSTNVLVMGDMGELGVSTADMHQQVGHYAQQQQVDHVYTCGVVSREAALTAGVIGRAFLAQPALVDALADLITTAPKEQVFTLLFKGSRSAKMEQAISLLTTKLSENTAMLIENTILVKNTVKEIKC
ncbi:UDP-N-acetylmuramoyl-tripeptide--D-alanyl-D-alanine ligase [Moritella viscosa]|uniref:UDP-N-acetylmuramoyl-tripeptide--D-alanyl-D-alanine ligase n=1 Tax=Moritella viscosa TaxID=80854 RepID=A0A090IIA8_9GAMM|nr:UDP-N-acetylmuramoyl-tripeptide--D-alanyl-D-alanine ligase [Moritella viscosa]CED62066.1 UDP-N-acetylmuramoyl-tripeptide--D-alanyl-D-ala nine ligase [Moritella viscosa]SGZ02146.1 UDP-N-acetylmuramoyl-tripeptide--D-alanyl-D-alanine ligase [Moritella viscosa]SHO07053.1 UDP-N-acetylmuramoyl-tripeptide--D-alanyl-D-alanine ligase [Moritella viscosa]SHO07184.1 UDP-N-acetylmuramoyl-tripeptide--D-alanyl-D-alanine ligase [Moritella viscosa]SHO08129.1 UDP-N-acetylmuramoyl-tripeptide--D-alanyl-D-alani